LSSSPLAFRLPGGSQKEGLVPLFEAFCTDDLRRDVTADAVRAMFADLSWRWALILAPVMAGSIAVALAANYVQVGFLFAGQPLMPKLNKLNPVEGFQRMFSLRSVVDFLKSLFKLL